VRPLAVNGVKDLINCKTLSCQDIIGRVGQARPACAALHAAARTDGGAFTEQRTEEMDTQALLKTAGLEGMRLVSRITTPQ
jgi:hypothetical protein